MTIASEIQRIKTNIANAYDALENKGATMPATEDSANLASTVNTVSTGGTIESLSITPSTSAQTITATGGVDGYSPINVSAVTSSIDANIVAGNIKDGVSILGVTGTLTSGDEITATNTTGSAVSADDRVWVNGEDVYIRDFTVQSYNGNSPTINDETKILTISKVGTYIYKNNSNQSSPSQSVEVVIKAKLIDYQNASGNIPVSQFFRSSNSTSGGTIPCNIHWNSSGLQTFINDSVSQRWQLSPSASSIQKNVWYYYRIQMTSTHLTQSYSTDGISWQNSVNSDTTINFSGKFNGKYFLVGIGNGNNLQMELDLSECYVKVDGNTVWTPYVKTGTNYSIINDTDITSTSFTGIAQANIANNATGSIKTLLDGNGTYAPTTATKSITTNGTYTASAENAYGLSSVTVNVPSPDVWYNWKNTEYTPDFTNMNSYGTISDGIYTLTPRVPNPKEGGVCKILDNAFNYSSDFEVVIKVKISNLIQNDQTRSIFYLGADGNSFYNSLSNTLIFCTRGNTVNNFGWFLYNTLIIQGSDSFSNMTNDTWYWFKLTYNATSNILTTYQSVDGITYTQIATASYTLPSSSVGTYILLGLSEFNSTTAYTGYVDLRASYVKSGDDIVWTPYTENSSQCYTLTASPTTSTQVYEIPKKTSALTITAVGTGTITLSDSKVYNRNSAGDVQSPVLGTKTITSNNTYTAASDYLDGFSSVTVDVPSAPTKKYNLLDRVKDDSNNEIGTVSGFFTDANNVEYAVVCLDAQYRSDITVGWCTDNSTVVTGLPTYDENTWGPWEAKETATYNTQKIIDYIIAGGAASADACFFCRAEFFTIDGTRYYGQLPNMIELNDIQRNHTAIDAADPTASTYISKTFSECLTWWSSSQYNYENAWCTEDYGEVLFSDKSIDGSYYVVPVLEIPNT